MKLEKTDGGFVLPVPQDVIAALDLHEGDDVELRKVDSAPGDGDASAHESGMSVIRRFRGIFPAGFKFDREEANAR